MDRSTWIKLKAMRDAFFAQHGFLTLRFHANEIFPNTDGVLERILDAIRVAPTQTLPQRWRE